ncbi:MAG: YqaE/Pmp3 family membrane protein [Rhodobacterales bacterium]|nr:YqaE/Pmp3 family membrane protein [Rhodobacterales bacterium]
MSILMILLTIIFPPLPVALKEGIGLQLLLNVLLTLIGWLPGVVHAFWVQTRGPDALEI